MQLYTDVKELLKQKEAIDALNFDGGLIEKVITSNTQSQTDDLRVNSSY